MVSIGFSFPLFIVSILDRKDKLYKRQTFNMYSRGGYILLIIFSIIAWNILPNQLKGMINYVTYIFPIFRSADFFTGMCLGVLYKRKKDEDICNNIVLFSILEVVLVLSLLIIQFYRGSKLSWWTEAIVYIPITSIIIWVFAVHKGFITSFLIKSKNLGCLGNISGYTFLIHWVVIKYLHVLNDSYFDSGMNIYLLSIISLIITILMACLYSFVYRTFKKLIIEVRINKV